MADVLYFSCSLYVAFMILVEGGKALLHMGFFPPTQHEEVW